MGVTDAQGRPLPDHGAADILLPQGSRGPAFATFRNFDVLLRYNNAVNYGIGVGHLSDRLAGKPPVQAAFPPDAQGLTLETRKEMQRLLTQRGFDAGDPDGVIGSKTVEAIRAYQQARGMAVTGEPSQALLQALRRG
jgi:hypothetical protein